jgi:small-conductance mechanosensitive channel
MKDVPVEGLKIVATNHKAISKVVVENTEHIPPLFTWLSGILNIPVSFVAALTYSFLLIIIIFVARYLIFASLKKIKDRKKRYYWHKFASYASWIIFILMMSRIWIASAKYFDGVVKFSAAGLVAGLAVALQEPIKNLAGFIFILARTPFKVGDRIEIDGVMGDVIDIGAMTFTLVEIGNWVNADQSTGRVIHAPNGVLLSKHVINYGEGFEFIWHELPVLVTFESDWRKAKGILKNIVNEYSKDVIKRAEDKMEKAAQRHFIFYKNLTPIIYTSVQDSGVMLTVRYLIEPRRRRNSEMSIWEDILEQFSKSETIDFAYPTQRFYNNISEGKQQVIIARKPDMKGHIQWEKNQ